MLRVVAVRHGDVAGVTCELWPGPGQLEIRVSCDQREVGKEVLLRLWENRRSE